MARICISKKRKYPYIKFHWFSGIEQSSLGFNKVLTAKICGFEIKEFNDKYPEYAIQYDKDEDGDALIKVHIPANGDTVIGGTITTIKDNATKSENYTTYTTETLSGDDCYYLDAIFTARLGGRELSIWRTDDGKLYIHKLQLMYHSDSIAKRISRWCRHRTIAYEEDMRQLNRKPFGFAYKTEIGSDNVYKKKMSINVEKPITITGARIVHSNLRGVEEEYNRAGHGYIMFKLPDGLAFLNCKGGYLKVNIAEHVIPTIKIDNHVYSGSYADFDNLVRGGAIARIEVKPVSFTNSITKEAIINYYLTELEVAKYTIKDLYYAASRVTDNIKAKERKNAMTDFEKIIVNGPATIAWVDGRKEIVKLHKGDIYDAEKAILLLFAKSLFIDDKAFHGWMRRQMKLMAEAKDQYERKNNIGKYDTSIDILDELAEQDKSAFHMHEDTDMPETQKPKRGRKPGVQPKTKDMGGEKVRWTETEINVLYDYKDKGPSWLADRLGRSRASVQEKMRRLGLQKKRGDK